MGAFSEWLQRTGREATIAGQASRPVLTAMGRLSCEASCTPYSVTLACESTPQCFVAKRICRSGERDIDATPHPNVRGSIPDAARTVDSEPQQLESKMAGI